RLEAELRRHPQTGLAKTLFRAVAKPSRVPGETLISWLRPGSHPSAEQTARDKGTDIHPRVPVRDEDAPQQSIRKPRQQWRRVPWEEPYLVSRCHGSGPR